MNTTMESRITSEAQTMADLILPSELQDLRDLARSLDLDPVEVCVRFTGVEPERLHRALVPDVMEWLRARGAK